MKPVLYLDVDDTLLIWPAGIGAPGAPEFIRWAKTHFEVRWLTMWCPSGDLYDLAPVLAGRLNMPVAELAEIRNPVPFWRTFSTRDKTTSIVDGAIAEGRTWVWVEDEFLDHREADWVYGHPQYTHNYYETTVSRDPEALLRTWRELATRFSLPAEIPTLAGWEP